MTNDCLLDEPRYCPSSPRRQTMAWQPPEEPLPIQTSQHPASCSPPPTVPPTRDIAVFPMPQSPIDRFREARERSPHVVEHHINRTAEGASLVVRVLERLAVSIAQNRLEFSQDERRFEVVDVSG